MSEYITNVSDASFEQDVLKSDSPVLVDYWAEWCGPCKMIAPVLDEIAKDYQGKLKVCKLNIDENQDTPPKYGVRGIPTLMLFKNGAVEATKVGAPQRAVALEDMAVVAGQHDHAAGCLRLVQQGLQERHAVESPADTDLVAAAEEVVHCVQDGADHAALRRGDGGADFGRKGTAGGVDQLALMEEHRRVPRAACLAKRRGEPALLVGRDALRHRAAQQARSADLGHRRKGRHDRGGRRAATGAREPRLTQRHPSAPYQIVEEL